MIRFGWKSREQRDVGLEVTLAENRGLIGQTKEEDRESRKVERAVLHVGVNEVDRGARGLPSVDDRQIAGVDETVDCFSRGQLGDHGIEVNTGLLLRYRRSG